MLVDCLTKQMHPAQLVRFLHAGEYSHKYDKVIKDTEHEQAKRRKEARELSALQKKTTVTADTLYSMRQ